MKIVAGVDCSTQSTEVVVVSTDDGQIVGSAEVEHSVEGSGGARETDPGEWRDGLSEALARTGMASEIEAISVAGQQHGLVVCGEADEPIRPAILWNDTRSAREAEDLIEWLGGATAWAERVGVVPVPSITVTKWLWLRRNEPEHAAAARSVSLPHDWLTGQLTGRPSTDRGDASGSGWWSAVTESYDDAILDSEFVDLSRDALPVVRGPSEMAGYVTATASERFGLTQGIPVGPGTGDNMAAALGLGLESGSPVVSLGTSGTAYVVSEESVQDPSGVVAGFCDASGRWLPLACTLNCTLAIDRIAALLGLHRDRIAPRTGVTFLPYLDGERTPNLPLATGTMVGLTHDTQPEEVLRGAYEGAAAALLLALEKIDALGSGIDPEAPITLVGGGAQGEAWRRVIASLSGRALRVPAQSNHVALGAAAQAAGVLLDIPPTTVASRWGHGQGTDIPAQARDVAAVERIERVTDRAVPLLTASA